MTGRPTGNASARDYGDDFARLNFVVQSIVGRKATVELVRVAAVHNTGDVAPVGVLDVVPMVHQVDGAGKAVEHGTIHNVPYLRLQGGPSAVILDPAVGDIGIAVFAARDISKVKSTKAPALPGSRRRMDWADALYLGGVLNQAPAQYLRFTAAGIELVAPLVSVPGNFQVGTGADGSFATGDGRTVTVRGGIITEIA